MVFSARLVLPSPTSLLWLCKLYTHQRFSSCWPSRCACFFSAHSQAAEKEEQGDNKHPHTLGMSLTLLGLHNRRTSSTLSQCHSAKQAPFLAASGSKELLPADNGDEDEAHTERPGKILTVPTILTLGRVAAIPVLVLAFYSNGWWATAGAAGIFVSAALTDWLDGFLARKMGSHSAFGAFLDPVADKLMVATTLVLLSSKPLQVSWAVSISWLVPLAAVAIIGREITMSAVREWAASQSGDLQAAVAVNRLGKWKTATQMVALTVLLATRNVCCDGSGSNTACMVLAVGVTLLYVSAGLALWSLVVYMRGIWGALMK